MQFNRKVKQCREVTLASFALHMKCPQNDFRNLKSSNSLSIMNIPKKYVICLAGSSQLLREVILKAAKIFVNIYH